MKKLHKEERELPFEVGQTYISKMQTADKFTITKIVTRKSKITGYTEVSGFLGIWEKSPHLGDCPVDADRLHPRKEFTGQVYEVCVCPKCKHEYRE